MVSEFVFRVEEIWDEVVVMSIEGVDFFLRLPIEEKNSFTLEETDWEADVESFFLSGVFCVKSGGEMGEVAVG